MRAKVIIENEKTTIELVPDNDFEKEIIEKVTNNKHNYKLDTTFDARYNYGSYDRHKITIAVNNKEIL